MQELNIVEYFRILLKRWKLLAAIFLAATITSAVISLTLPEIYLARTTIFAGSAGGGLSSLLSKLPIASMLRGGGGGSNSDYLLILINSSHMRFELSNRLDLEHNPKFNPSGEPLTKTGLDRLLAETVYTLANDNGLISINVETRDPELSAKMANEIPLILEEIIYASERSERVFLEEQLSKNRKELTEAEAALKQFQEEHGVFVVEKQAAAELDLAAEIEADLIQTNISLEGVKIVADETVNWKKLDELKDEEKKLRKQRDMLRQELDEIKAKMENIPGRMQEYKKLLRDVKVLETVFEELSSAYHMAVINEKDQDRMFQVIDTAIVPEIPIKPKKRLNVIIAGLASIFVGIILVFFLEMISRIRSSEKEP